MTSAFVRVLALCLVAGSAGAATPPQPREVDVLWMGTYRIAETKPVADPTAPSGYRYVAQGIVPVNSTQRVPAVVGSRFGIAYVLKGGAEGTVVPVQAFWRFPPRGLTNPETRTTVFEWKTTELQCRVEQKPFCLIGYPLQHPWELVPGRWSVEIWVEGVKSIEASFDLYVP